MAKRLTPDEKLAKLETERAALLGMRESSTKKSVAEVIPLLRAIANSPVESLRPIRDECKGMAARLEGWVGR